MLSTHVAVIWAPVSIPMFTEDEQLNWPDLRERTSKMKC
jgi:hypothetical protein